MIGKTRLRRVLIKRNIDIVIICLAMLMGVYFDWKIVEILIFGIFIWTILNPISNRYLVFLALLFLSLTPFLIIFKKPELAERTSIYAYYFLIMAVIMGVYEVWKEKGDVS